MLFKLVPDGFSYLINWKNLNSNWKKLLGFRNIQEKLEKIFFVYFEMAKKNLKFLRHESVSKQKNSSVLFYMTFQITHL